MAVNKAGQSEARAELLLADCESFGYAREDALAFIKTLPPGTRVDNAYDTVFSQLAMTDGFGAAKMALEKLVLG